MYYNYEVKKMDKVKVEWWLPKHVVDFINDLAERRKEKPEVIVRQLLEHYYFQIYLPVRDL